MFTEVVGEFGTEAVQGRAAERRPVGAGEDRPRGVTPLNPPQV
jgi:hypothetical protein